MAYVRWLISLSIVAAALLVGCGGGDSTSTSGGSAASAQAKVGKAAPGAVQRPKFTQADTQMAKAITLGDEGIHRLLAGEHSHVVAVIPWYSEGGRRLVGAEVKIKLRPPTRLADERLPVTISPDHQAPPGTPTLDRFARVSARNVTELDAMTELAARRVVRIEPAGNGVEVTKFELIGPAPTSPAYQPEPGY